MSTNAPPVETVPISKLFCSPANPRLNDAAVPHVAASIRRFGWQQPIVAKRSGEVIAGNTPLMAAQSLGMTEVPVWWFDGTDLDAVAFSVADNKSHEWASWDEPALAALLQQLRAEYALDGVGFSTDDIDALVQQLREQEEIDRDLVDDGPDEPPRWLTGSSDPGRPRRGSELRRAMSVVDGDLRESFLETVEEQLGAALAERGLAGETGLGDHAESSLRRVAIRRALELCHMLTIEGRPFRWCFPRRGA